ncbi:MAG: hypothetical protein KBB64_12510 [Bacteroidia bacterium]|jgi:hypothetical protein|nr:hypothetical protein [Bacteroidia bacterium]
MKRFLLLTFFVAASMIAPAQKMEILINDNLAKMNMGQTYRITNDSLVVTGKADYGRSNVDYLRRTLTSKEKKKIQKLLSTFPVDSLRPEYFDDYSNFKIIDEEHYPRSIDISITWKEKTTVSRATNAWVSLYMQLIDAVNPFFPEEVRVVVDKSKFNVFY